MTLLVNPARDAAISEMLAERIAAGDFPSAVYLVAVRWRVQFTDALGDAVREPEAERRPATLETIYDLASLTKPLVTGFLCAQALERGLFDLDDPVGRHLYEFNRPDKRRVTIRHLLTHTSGLPAWKPLYLICEDRTRVLETIAAQPLEYEPGGRVVYSDLGFITLGLLLQRLCFDTFDVLARRSIFLPCGLNTFFNPPATLKEKIAASECGGNAYERDMCEGGHRLRHEHGWRDRTVWGEVHDGNAYFLGGAAGHAGLFSTAATVHRIATQFITRTSRSFRPETCALFRTNMTEGLNEARSFAWQLAATPDSTAGPRLPPEAFGHLGFTGTSCWIDPLNERIFILLTNRTHARPLPFVNINSTRRSFHTLAVEALERDGG